MIKLTRVIIVLCSSYLFLSLISGCAEKKTAGLYTIGIVQITENPVLDLARNSALAALREQGFVEGKNIRIEYQNAQGDMPTIPLILKNFISKKVDMVLTVSTPCMAAAAQTVKDIPVVFTVAFSPQQIGITTVPQNLYGVYDPFDMAAFVQLIRACIPAATKIGILCNRAEPNASFGADKLKEECVRQNLELVEVPVFSSNDVLQAAQSLALKQVDAFAIAADNTVYLAMDALVKVAETRKIPLFVTDASQVDRGAGAGCGIDYAEWGRESGKIAAAIIKGRKPEQDRINALRHNVIYLNLPAAQKQGLVIPAEIISKADKIIN